MRVIADGDREVDQFVETDEGQIQRENNTNVAGSGGIEAPVVPTQLNPGAVGTTTTIPIGDSSVTVVNVVGLDTIDRPHLAGTWIDTHAPRLLAHL